MRRAQATVGWQVGTNGICRPIAFLTVETFHAAAPHACSAALLAAQNTGAPGPELVSIIAAFHREWKALEAVVDELGA